MDIILGASIMLVGVVTGVVISSRVNQGKQGPQGPTGPQGPMGPKGEKGGVI